MRVRLAGARRGHPAGLGVVAGLSAILPLDCETVLIFSVKDTERRSAVWAPRKGGLESDPERRFLWFFPPNGAGRRIAPRGLGESRNPRRKT